MSASLVPVEDGTPIVLDKTILLVGRHPDCDVVLTDSRKISRKHCCFAQVNSHFVVRDLGSVNGVWVNGEKIRRQARIEIGDYVAIGDLQYQVQEVRGSKRTPASRNANSPEDQRSQDADGKPRLPLNLSQSAPIAIPDQSESFSVEPSVQGSNQPPPLSDQADEATPDDRKVSAMIPIAESGQHPNRDEADQDDILPVAENHNVSDAIPLAESGEFDENGS